GRRHRRGGDSHASAHQKNTFRLHALQSYLSEAHTPRQKATLRRYKPPPAYYLSGVRAQQASLACYDSIYLSTTASLACYDSIYLGTTALLHLGTACTTSQLCMLLQHPSGHPTERISSLRARQAGLPSHERATTASMHLSTTALLRLGTACTTSQLCVLLQRQSGHTTEFHHVHNKPASPSHEHATTEHTHLSAIASCRHSA
ncbi:unnamed protein product, partial [Ectocarpus sp. 8 AP-2014]